MQNTDYYDLRSFVYHLAGNWKEFDSFGWDGKYRDDAARLGIWYVLQRDSTLLEESNAQALAAALKPHLEADTDDPDIWQERHRHWAVGWIEGYVIRVTDEQGKPTEAAEALWELIEQMRDYPILDEQDYMQREYEAAIQAIQEQLRYIGGSPAAASDVYAWLSENDNSQLENTDDTGAYPDEESIRAACAGLGLQIED
jgi:hypothetical protein